MLLQAAEYLAASAAIHGTSPLTTFPIYKVKGVVDPVIEEGTTNMKYVIIGALVILVLGLLIGVLVATQRKRAQGITWFPEGFLRNNRFVFTCSLYHFRLWSQLVFSLTMLLI